MQMDETTQQNAALVEETTSASQSMKDQARELMRQVEVFKTDGASEGTGSVSHRAVPVPFGRGQTPRAAALKNVSPQIHMNKKPLGGARPADDKEPVDVAAGNGKDRRGKEAEFEEF
jgi:methyl-accepting chemotaxis protein